VGVDVRIETYTSLEVEAFRNLGAPEAHWSYGTWNTVLRCFFGEQAGRMDGDFTMIGRMDAQAFIVHASEAKNRASTHDREIVKRVYYTLAIAEAAQRLNRDVVWS